VGCSPPRGSFAEPEHEGLLTAIELLVRPATGQ
jgi:hypothetical protein